MKRSLPVVRNFSFFCVLSLLMLGACAKKEGAVKSNERPEPTEFKPRDCVGVAKKIPSKGLGLCLDFLEGGNSLNRRVGNQSFRLRFFKLGADRTVMGETIPVDFLTPHNVYAWMPDPSMMHPPSLIKLTWDAGKGSYLAKDVDFFMPGTWEVVVGKGTIADPPVFSFEAN